VKFIGEGYDDKVKEAQAATDDAARAKLAIELEKQWTEAVVWIPVAHTPATIAMSKDITGAPSSASFLYYPWAADVGTSKK
jgi:peptide/nickel transport system substrate-binding protein